MGIFPFCKASPRAISLAAVAAISSAMSMVPAQAQQLGLINTNPLFADKPERDQSVLGKLSGAITEYAVKGARVAGKPGGYAQVLYEQWEGGDNSSLYELYSLYKKGNAQAQAVLAWMHDNGVGVPQNSERAAQLAISSAPTVELSAYNLGVMYLYGRGVEQDEDRAMEWFGKCARISHAQVQLAYHALRQQKGNMALIFAQKAAASRDLEGMYLYGRLLVEKGDSKEGANLLRRAARGDHPQAISSMIVLLERGIGQNKDAGLSVGWWIVDQVLNKGVALDIAEQGAERFDLSNVDRRKALGFARKWLLGRSPSAQFDYTKTMNFGDLKRL